MVGRSQKKPLPLKYVAQSTGWCVPLNDIFCRVLGSRIVPCRSDCSIIAAYRCTATFMFLVLCPQTACPDLAPPWSAQPGAVFFYEKHHFNVTAQLESYKTQREVTCAILII
jgi:hypothetical protein